LGGIATGILQKNPVDVELLNLFDPYPLVYIVPGYAIRG
jgi:hypothetical protein